MKWDTAKEYTIGDQYRPAMAIESQEEASEYLEGLVQYNMTRHGQSREEATGIQLSNLGYFAGYFAGYYDHETRLRVEKLFSCSHPIFGAASSGAPSAEEAFEMGKSMAGGTS